jgi:hypothetical protein
MAHEVWLGPEGAEVHLAPANWIIGSPGSYPETFKKNLDSAIMLDGRTRYDFKQTSQRSWALSWALLDKSAIDALQALSDLRQSLRFRPGLAAQTAWHTVVIKSFSFAPVMQTFRPGGAAKFSASMALEEANG